MVPLAGDVATEALTLALDYEEPLHKLNRLAHPSKESGLLRDDRRLKGLSQEAREAAKGVRDKVLPRMRERLATYSERLVFPVKKRGSRDTRYGLTLGLGTHWERLEEWSTWTKRKGRS